MHKIERIVNQYADDSAFLWTLRGQYVTAPNIALRELTKHDERIDAHLDGLRIAGDSGWECLKKNLETGDPGDIFAAAVLAYEFGVEDRIQQVIRSGVASLEASRGLISALGWLPYDKVEPHIRWLRESKDSNATRVGVSADAIQRKISLPALVAGVAHEDPWLRARTLRAVGEMGKIELLPDLLTNLNDPNGNCRFWAAWSAALLGDHSGIDVLAKAADFENEFTENVLNILPRALELPTANAWQHRLAGNAKCARAAVIGAGVIGDPVHVPWLMEQMKKLKIARLAAAAFSMITGVDMTDLNLGSDSPENFESGPTDSPEDENVATDPDEKLPWPDCAKIAVWWSRNRDRYRVGTRLLLGRPLDDEHWLGQVLGKGFQRQRAAAALELALRRPGQPLFNIKAPGFRQKSTLGVE